MCPWLVSEGLLISFSPVLQGAGQVYLARDQTRSTTQIIGDIYRGMLMAESGVRKERDNKERGRRRQRMEKLPIASVTNGSEENSPKSRSTGLLIN